MPKITPQDPTKTATKRVWSIDSDGVVTVDKVIDPDLVWIEVQSLLSDASKVFSKADMARLVHPYSGAEQTSSLKH